MFVDAYVNQTIPFLDVVCNKDFATAMFSIYVPLIDANIPLVDEALGVNITLINAHFHKSIPKSRRTHGQNI